jgi:hypothetical protein
MFPLAVSQPAGGVSKAQLVNRFALCVALQWVAAYFPLGLWEVQALTVGFFPNQTSPNLASILLCFSTGI